MSWLCKPTIYHIVYHHLWHVYTIPCYIRLHYIGVRKNEFSAQSLVETKHKASVCSVLLLHCDGMYNVYEKLCTWFVLCMLCFVVVSFWQSFVIFFRVMLLAPGQSYFPGAMKGPRRIWLNDYLNPVHRVRINNGTAAKPREVQTCSHIDHGIYNAPPPPPPPYHHHHLRIATHNCGNKTAPDDTLRKNLVLTNWKAGV